MNPRWNGHYGRGAAKEDRLRRRREAIERNLHTPAERTAAHRRQFANLEDPRMNR